MSARAGNQRTIYIGVQADATTVAAAAVLKLRVRNFSRNPVRQIIALEETDAATQEGGSVVAGITPGGALDLYLRPSEADLLMYALFGAAGDSGTTPNWIHELTPDQDTPYLTIWEVEPDLWSNRFKGCRITQATISGGAGQPLELTGLQFEALEYTAHVTEPAAPAAPFDELPFIYPEVTITRDGEARGDADQFSLTINRNGQRIQGDNGFGSLDYVNGKWQVSGQITQLHVDDDDLRAVDTGSATGTDVTEAIDTAALSIKALRNANLSIEFAMTKVSLTTATVGVNTDGSPLAQVLAFRTEPTTDIDDNLTCTVKNAIENSDHSP